MIKAIQNTLTGITTAVAQGFVVGTAKLNSNTTGKTFQKLNVVCPETNQLVSVLIFNPAHERTFDTIEKGDSVSMSNFTASGIPPRSAPYAPLGTHYQIELKGPSIIAVTKHDPNSHFYKNFYDVVCKDFLTPLTEPPISSAGKLESTNSAGKAKSFEYAETFTSDFKSELTAQCAFTGTEVRVVAFSECKPTDVKVGTSVLLMGVTSRDYGTAQLNKAFGHLVEIQIDLTDLPSLKPKPASTSTAANEQQSSSSQSTQSVSKVVINIKAPHGGVLSNGQVVTMTKERTAEAQKAVFETVMGVTLGVEGFYTGTGIFLGPGGGGCSMLWNALRNDELLYVNMPTDPLEKTNSDDFSTLVVSLDNKKRKAGSGKAAKNAYYRELSSLVTEHGPLDADMPALAKALDIDLGTHDIALQSSAFEKTVEWKKDDLLRESRTAGVGTTEMSPQKKKPKK